MTSRTENLSCDISSLENDTEMVVHFDLGNDSFSKILQLCNKGKFMLFLLLLVWQTLLRSLRSYFVVKSLHFIKESKSFFLSSYTMKPRKSRKRLKKCILEIEGFQSVILPWNSLQTCHLNT